MKKLSWRNIKIGGKYIIVLSVVTVTFLFSILITYFLLQKTSETMVDTKKKNDIATQASELVRIYNKKYLQIPQYIIFSDEKRLEEYLDDSKDFVEVAKSLKSKIQSDNQLSIFNQMMKNNNQLDEYFFSMIVPKVQQINTAEFKELQKSADQMKEQTDMLGEKLKNISTESNRTVLISAERNINKTITLLLISGLVSIIISYALVLFISRKINKELSLVVSTSDEIAKGNLQFKELSYQGLDEIGMLSKSINNMGVGLREMILEVSFLAKEIDENSLLLAESSSEVKTGSEQIAYTIEELATGTSNQAQEVSTISESTRAFLNQLIAAKDNADKLDEYSNIVNVVLTTGDQQMIQSLNQMNVINQVVENAVNKVQNLNNKISSITELVHVIKSIAEQTNLLSLNASIEAARAGEAGKGFAVVASEVRKLADEVTNSVKNITAIVDSVKDESVTMSRELSAGFKEVNKGSEQIEATGKAFSEIKEKINEMNHQVSGILNTLVNINSFSVEINGSVENIAGISEESAAGAQEISAAAHQQYQGIDSITNSAEKLKVMVRRMSEMIKNFKL